MGTVTGAGTHVSRRSSSSLHGKALRTDSLWLSGASHAFSSIVNRETFIMNLKPSVHEVLSPDVQGRQLGWASGPSKFYPTDPPEMH